jgi:hydrogenase 3 maturation protease
MPKRELRLALTRRLEGARSIAVLGVGSELRGDDAAGVRAAERLARMREARATEARENVPPSLRVIIGGTAPENVTGEIKALSPSHLILIDCADMGLPPGSLRILERRDIAGTSFGTHRASLGIFLDYIAQEVQCDVFVLAIQPAALEFGKGMTAEAASAADEAAEAIAAAAVTVTAEPV